MTTCSTGTQNTGTTWGGGPSWDEFPTAGAVPCAAGGAAKSKGNNAEAGVSGGNAARSRVGGGNAARSANAGDIVPAMP